MATSMNTGAVLGQGMLILDVTRTAARSGPVNPTKGGWSKRSEITESQVAVFRGVANHALLLFFPDQNLKAFDQKTRPQTKMPQPRAGSGSAMNIQRCPPRRLFSRADSTPSCLRWERRLRRSARHTAN